MDITALWLSAEYLVPGLISPSSKLLLLCLPAAVCVRGRAVVRGMQGAGLLQQPPVQLLWPAGGVQPHQAPPDLPAVLPAGGSDGNTQGKLKGGGGVPVKIRKVYSVGVASWGRPYHVRNPGVSDMSGLLSGHIPRHFLLKTAEFVDSLQLCCRSVPSVIPRLQKDKAENYQPLVNTPVRSWSVRSCPGNLSVATKCCSPVWLK